jgi:hypothetical protein
MAWRRSFVAMTVLVGGTVDDALAALEPRAEAALGDLTAKLRDPRRPVRAQALAGALHETAAALAEVTLA